MKRYEISCTITEIDKDHEIVEDGFNGDLSCVILLDIPPGEETGEHPVIVLKRLLRPMATDFCT